MRAAGYPSCLYFISLVILGNIIMLNLFLAILLGNFDAARKNGEKKKIFHAFQSLIHEGNFELNIAIGLVFDDAEFVRYIEDKILNDHKDDAQAIIDEENEDEDDQTHTQ